MSIVLRPTRSSTPVDDILVFFAMPYGKKALRHGDPGALHDFDDLYNYQLKRPLLRMGLQPFRADETPGTGLVLEAAWDGIDRAGIVVVDFSAVSESVALEVGWAMCLHKRMIVLAQDESDIPADLRGIRPIVYDFTPRGTGELVERLQDEIERLRRQPLREMDLKPRNPLVATRAVVESVFEDRVRVRDLSNSQRSAELFRSDVSYTELLPPHGMPKRFHVGWELTGAFLVRDDLYVFSQKEIEDDPWGKWEETYPLRSTLTARVHQVKDNDAFIELPGGGKSRVSIRQGEELRRGDEVSVEIMKVDRALHRIDVRRADQPAFTPAAPEAYPPVGERQEATVRDIRPDLGFVLVDLEGYPQLPRPSMLHISKMTPGLRQRFEADRVLRGDRLTVQVTDVSHDPKRPGQLKVEVRDLAAEAAADPPEADAEPVA
ncbi:hypothetical protein [Streptomyces sp. NPDC053048]|uniref:hypothetical protein n=1 Tax=Streptomyces sp. NPDC053048 TaxID=3365694 RepID=UPI0037D1E36F